MRGSTDHLSPAAFFAALEERPYDFDFFQALRRIECLFPDQPRIGQALRPGDEAIRFSQEPSLAFAPATLSAFRPRSAAAPPRLEVRFFGLLGPNGPLPLHLTEYARERMLHADDSTFPRFLDLLHHRFIALFYRAWAQAHPTTSLDRPKEDRFAAYVGSQFGIGTPSLAGRDPIAEHAKLYYSGLLVRHVRNRDGLTALLQAYFGVRVRIEEFVGHWMQLEDRDRTRLGSPSRTAVLGHTTVLGTKVWDQQHKFRIVLGGLTLREYEDFLPGGTALAKLVAWVRQYLCFELEWDARLLLLRAQVPKIELGRYGRLGWTTWLGRYASEADAGSLTLDAERVMNRRGARGSVPLAAGSASI